MAGGQVRLLDGCHAKGAAVKLRAEGKGEEAAKMDEMVAKLQAALDG